MASGPGFRVQIQGSGFRFRLSPALHGMGCSDTCKIKSTNIVLHAGQQESIKVCNVELDPFKRMMLIQLPHNVEVVRTNMDNARSTFRAAGHAYLLSEKDVQHLVLVSCSPWNGIFSPALLVNLPPCPASNN